MSKYKVQSFRPRHRRKDIRFIALFVAVTLASFAATFFLVRWAVLYEEIKTVHVEDKWWVYTKYVKYDEYECSYTVNYDGDLVSGCSWETSTRCSTNRVGREDVPIPPELGCRVHMGDYIRENVTYVIRYRLQETDIFENKTVHKQTWYSLDIPVWVEVTLGLSGYVKEVKQ